MKSKIIFLLICTLFISGFISAQYEITIDAYVLDRDTQKAIPFVNVGFLDEGIGTVSDQNGHIFLQYDEQEINRSNVFQLSSLGYKTMQLSVKELFQLLTNNNTILMEPAIYELEAATVTAEKRMKKTVGRSSVSNGFMGYWKDAKALGGEIGTRIRISHKNSKLLRLKFNINENITDSLLVRVNVHEHKRRAPGRNMLTSNIYHTITKEKGEEVIDLMDYNIVVHDDIIVSLELVKVYGEDIEFSIGASKEGISYLRSISQDHWDVHWDIGMAFSVDISYPVEEGQLRKRENPDDIVLYWDTSFSATNHDPEYTYQFLKAYLKKIENTTVTLIPFSNTIHEQQKFDIRNGKSNQLIESLSKMDYNGATNFSALFKEENKPDQYLVVSDGRTTFGSFEQVYDVPVFYINHLPNPDDLLLHKAAVQSEGYYLNLTKISVDQALSNIVYELEDNNVYQIDKNQELIKGLVTSGGKPVQGCKVSVKGTLIQTTTDANGSFSIDASMEDVLTFDFFGMESQEIALDARKNIKVDLISNHTVLEEVIVETKESNESDDIVKDVYGNNVNKKSIGHAYYTVEEEDFLHSAIYLSDLIRGQFPGVQVFGWGDEAVYEIRTKLSLAADNSTPPLFVVDGLQFNEPPTFLFPTQIKSISVLTGLSASARFGQAARNGVFIITTKYGDISNNKDGKPINDLLVKGNDYTTSSFLLDVNHNRPSYLDELWNSTSYKEAKEIYYSLRKKYPISIPFYSYSASYFRVWNTAFADQVLSNISEIGFDNPQALLVLAFKLEAIEEYHNAAFLYERIFDLAPDAAQSHLDLARIYVSIGKYKEAFELYKKILRNKESTMDFEEIAEQAESEIRRLLNFHRSELTYKDVPDEFLAVKGVPVRLVFQWSDPQSEFELQFVSPKKKFSKWKHVFRENKEELLSRVQSGVSSKEFIIDNAMPGEWIINVQSFGDASALNPAFMKYTMYTNYGLPNETKKVQCINLSNQKEKVTLDKIIL
ncbi:carboxypeptidase-like regulatory domain-containing protein [uncultured Aquimarina sp.]|uniref:carboxypeptidase-like regulatory domain-containing protein n=1 Tax=uncultured Aquimarina sp. TaxID=575652 RepID=UPI00260B0356|nr:carboxypeptidase-like regulatory domain-containing protein [uncultured Aquimarina sp.]